MIAAVDGFFEALFLFLLGVPNAPALGVIVFFGRFIPYIGGLVTTIILLFATLSSAGQTAAIVLLVLITILNVIQGKFLAPIVYHRTVHIHPALVLIALPAGAALAGIIGLFVAIPVVAFALAIAGALVSVLGLGPETQAMSSNPMVPVWLDRLGQWSWRLLVSIGLLGVFIDAVVQVPIVVIPVVLGVVLAATLAPLAETLERRGWSHDRAAIGATLGAAVGIIVIVGLTLVSLAPPISDMINSAIAGSSSADGSTGGQAGILVTLVQTFGTGVLVTIAGVLSTLAGIAVILLLATLLTFYFMRDGGAFWQAFLAPCRAGPTIACGGGRPAGVRCARRLHAGDRGHLDLRGCHPVPDHGHPRHPVRPAARGPGGLRRVHPVHRLALHDRPGVPRDRRDRDRRRTSRSWRSSPSCSTSSRATSWRRSSTAGS